MKQTTRMQLLAAFAAGSVLFAAGCDQRNTTTSSTTPATPPVSSATPSTAGRVAGATDNAADKVAAATERAGDKMAAMTEKAGDKIDDAAITAKVKTALMAEPGLKSLDINVDTRDNVVTLAGTVGTQELKQRASHVAQSVNGVKSVSDQLVVKPS